MGWVANLSDGSTFVETKPKKGKKSSWQSLLDHIQKNKLTMTGLRLQQDGKTIVCDAHKSVQGYCMAYDVMIELISGNYTKTQTVGVVVGTVYGDVVFMNWFDESGNVRQEIRPLSAMKPHTTLRDADDRKSTNTT